MRGPGPALIAVALAAALAAPGPPALRPDVASRLATDWNPAASFFPTSRWWWAAHPSGWGFANHVHVVHFNDLAAFSVEVRWNGVAVAPGRGTSRPDGVEVEAAVAGLAVRERKLLTADDVLVADFEFEATSPGRLEIVGRSPLAGQPDAGANDVTGRGTFHGVALGFCFAAAGARPAPGGVLRETRRIAGGEVVRVRFALAAALAIGDARAAANRALGTADLAAAERRRAEAWFSAQPQLAAPDRWVETAFLYRLAMARRSIQEPDAGRIRHPVAAEGRWAAKWYAAAIPFGAGHQLDELRWLRPAGLAWGHLQAFLDNQRGDGAFVGFRTDTVLGEYTDFLAASAYRLYQASGDADRFAAAAPALLRNVDYVLSRDCDGDFLPEPSSHWESGMEWQPSFFAFSDYDATREERLERVEYACFLHAGALAAARALELAGRGEQARRPREVARRVAAAIDGRMWDQAGRFYLALRARDDRMAPDREVPGFFPPAFGLSPPDRLGYLAAVTDPLRWAAPWPLPSVEMVSPAYSPRPRWPVGPGGSPSMWNGLVWPHALSFALRALAEGERRGALPPGTTLDRFESYTRAHFYAGPGGVRDPTFPLVGEAYDPVRGLWQSSERDYFHSTYVDLVVTLLAGIEPAEGDRLRVHPLVPPGRWDRFALVRVPYHGRELAVAWDEPGGEDAFGDGLEGLAVWVDGQLAASHAGMGPVELSLSRR